MKCSVCGMEYEQYGTQKNPLPNTVELTFLFPNGAGLQKIDRYSVCPCCMEAIRNILEGKINFGSYHLKEGD